MRLSSLVLDWSKYFQSTLRFLVKFLLTCFICQRNETGMVDLEPLTPSLFVARLNSLGLR